jgi:hypothetical protein
MSSGGNSAVIALVEQARATGCRTVAAPSLPTSGSPVDDRCRSLALAYPVSMTDEAASAGELRASHEDRDRTVDLLRVAAGDGRLTAEELDQRLERALTARTCGELTALTRDLPAVPGLIAGGPVEPKDLIRIDCHSGSARRDGRWVVPRRMEVAVTSGSVVLDFTEAVITQPSLRIDADVHKGDLTLVTQPGIMIDTDEVAVRGGDVKVWTPWNPQAPVLLRIQVSGRVDSGRIKVRPPRGVRPPRRTFWQWLRRRPARPRHPQLPPA